MTQNDLKEILQVSEEQLFPVLGRLLKAAFFIFIFLLLRFSNNVELESASPGPHHAWVQQRCTTVGILYINIHSFQSVVTEKYVSNRHQI